MNAEGYNSADLTSVLRTLSALSNNQSHQDYQNNPPSAHISSHAPVQQRTQDEEDDSYEPAEASPPFAVAQVHSTYQRTTGARAPSAQAPLHPNASSSIADSSSITTWPAALRHVMREVSQNEDAQRRIRRLIQSQHDHERQWWQGREALLQKQKARVEKKKELDAVLRFVGAPVDDTKQVSTAEEDQAELKNYNAKVYRASKQMAEAMTFELRRLGIPFFTIKESLISDAPKAPQHGISRRLQSTESASQHQALLSRDELSVLQRRMLELLQDLCKE
ncbi:hypothetical protein ALT_2977 [Aspergillus lentulus]|uniref:Uncharacterized protein n=1 Tax=Aspergillus lentulus TaxID=293939 RepID=A0AAN4PG06_ASPLE|nr:hypothetical protein CNMCM6069_008055 [Aspergillus lentulus]KAF4166539.1 hypothetical protein CNMCM6936_006378 [Aspergillus lentulus]KAF4174969.1 hypothetical protein CNMCM8060_007874 [Aspergillus lentulus]KAF4186938.1 hypothetical protein CNMCM7927_004847 [Aspergillus lentulus]KAF4196124.1 hypothetical protein CNMCM8694_005392 [Aspergillus lentulus]